MAEAGIQFESRDLASAVDALRRLGVRALRDLLEDGPGLRPSDWFPESDAALFGRVGLGRRPFAPSLVVSPRLLRSGDPARVERKIRKRAVAVRQAEGLRIPSRLWWLLAEAAWNSPRFRLDSGWLLTEHFRSRLVVSLDDFPPPSLPVEAMWLVVAAAPLQVSLLGKLGLRDRAALWSARRVRTVAHRCAPVSLQGAGFWAQWVAWLASRRRVRSRFEKTPPPAELAVEPEPSDAALPVQTGVRATWKQARQLRSIYDCWYPIRKEKN